MAENYLKQSALAHLHLVADARESRGEAGVVMSEAAPRGQISLRGDSGDKAFLAAARGGLGFELPLAANSTSGTAGLGALWLGPNEWLLVMETAAEPLMTRLGEAMGGLHHALVEVSESRSVILLSGPSARDLLAKATSLDLDPAAFRPGDCAQSAFALTAMILHQLDEDAANGPSYEIYLHRSMADYAWRWLASAAAEYGLAVATPAAP